jgi:endonuclease/exonuclease/phosphatase family metal-dependent hydrolase
MNEGSLVVLTQNAWGGAPLWERRREALARMIGDQGPDVVGLQEIHAETASGEGSQAHELAERIGGYDAFFAPGRVMASGHAEGVALLVARSWAARDRTVLTLSLDRGDPLEGPHQRVVLRVSIRRGDTGVDVLCTHLSLSQRARARTLGELCAFAARSGSAGSVLMGDFNAPPHEPALRSLAAAGWIDAWHHRRPVDVRGAAGASPVPPRTPSERGGTWPAVAPFRRIDYVWVHPGAGWAVTSARRTPVSGSDHVGLLATVRWPG